MKIKSMLLWLLLPFTAIAADVKISALPAGSAIAGTEAIPMVQSAATVKTTPDALKTYVVGAGSVAIASGKTFTANNSITLAGTDGVTVTAPTTTATMARTDAAQTFAGAQTFSSPIVLPESASNPGFRFSGTNIGLRHNSASDAASLRFFAAGADRIDFRAGHGVTLISTDGLKWNSTASITITYDTGKGRYAAGVVETNNGTVGNVRGLSGGGAAVASATALPLPTGRVFHVTGTTNITSITSTNFQHGVVITLIFDDVLTFTDGNNLKLSGDFVTTADDTIVLSYDGTNWFENSRSVN